METPTITQKQAKKALSGKKKKKGGTIKNIFASPFASFWPLLNEEDNNILLEKLNSFLPRLKNEKINIPYSKIKLIPKVDRKKYRQEISQQKPIKVEDSIRENIIFGVNDVTKSLEDRRAHGVLVASDATPRFLVQHIIDQSALLDCPVLVVANLRETLKGKCGISSVTVAFGMDPNSNSPLNVILENIVKLGEGYRKPSSHMHFSREISTIELSDSADESVLQHPKVETVQSTSCHLIRTQFNTRVFVPDNKKEEVRNIITLDLCSPAPAKKKKLVPNFRALGVKRVKANKHRAVELAQRMKKKRKSGAKM